jgi:hypothetical protein
MASIYEKKTFFILQCRWDTMTVLPKVYKFQSNNPHNKYKAKIHKDDGVLGIEFTLNKTIAKFISVLEKLNLDKYQALPSSAMCSSTATRPTGSKCSKSISRSLLTQKSPSQHKIVPWLRTSCVQLTSSWFAL